MDGRSIIAARSLVGRVEVHQMWAHSFEVEAKLIELLLPKFWYAAVDTEFPGMVYRLAGYMLFPERRYELLKLNVDTMDLIQLSLTLFDSDGSLPCLGGGAAITRRVWEFNFREFNLRHYRHTSESIAMLRAKGVDVDRTRQHDVDAAAFGRSCTSSYDLAYLVKVIYETGYELPGTAAPFEGVARSLLWHRLFDVKEMARLCLDDLRDGLDAVAAKLNVGRAVGETHTLHENASYFEDDGNLLATVTGVVLTDITAY